RGLAADLRSQLGMTGDDAGTGTSGASAPDMPTPPTPPAPPTATDGARPPAGPAAPTGRPPPERRPARPPRSPTVEVPPGASSGRLRRHERPPHRHARRPTAAAEGPAGRQLRQVPA